jgi:hypothetical protein
MVVWSLFVSAVLAVECLLMLHLLGSYVVLVCCFAAGEVCPGTACCFSYWSCQAFVLCGSTLVAGYLRP